MNIAPGEIGAAAAPLNRARSMPAGFYTDPGIFHRERERIFLKHWFFLCRDDQLPNVGDYRSFDTPGGPIVLVRSRDGRLRCFANCCRCEDVGILERQQRALRSVLYRPGPLSWRDDMVQALRLWVLERLDLV